MIKDSSENYGIKTQVSMRQNVWFIVDFMDLSKITKRQQEDDKKSTTTLR